MDELPDVRIYTDGACDPNPGPGGWAALLLYKDKKKEISGSEGKTTNNRMELTAAVKALEILDRTYRVDFYTDSKYLKKGITEWLPEWRRRNWRRKKGALANVDLWKALDSAVRDHKIEWHWVRGHAGNRFNRRVDYRARSAISK